MKQIVLLDNLPWRGRVEQGAGGPYWVEPFTVHVNRYLKDHPGARVVSVVRDDHGPDVSVVVEEDVEPGYRENPR